MKPRTRNLTILASCGGLCLLALLALGGYVGYHVWYDFYSPWPWEQRYETPLPDAGGVVFYEARPLPGRVALRNWPWDVRLTWVAPDGQRRSQRGDTSYEETHDVEFWLANDSRTVWVVGFHPRLSGPQVQLILDLTQEGPTGGEQAYTGEPFEPPGTVRERARPIARWLFLDLGTSMLNWSPQSSRTALRKQPLEGSTIGGGWAWVVESPDPIYRTGEVVTGPDMSGWAIIDHPKGAKLRVRAAYDHETGRFFDENLTVWEIGQSYEDPIVKSSQPASAYPAWTRQTGELRPWKRKAPAP